jgi:hypothetical protein
MYNVKAKKKFVQIMLDYKSNINYKIWKRKDGTNRVDFTITYGDAVSIVDEFIQYYPNSRFSVGLPIPKDMNRKEKLQLFDMFEKDVKSLLRSYVKENNLYNNHYKQ